MADGCSWDGLAGVVGGGAVISRGGLGPAPSSCKCVLPAVGTIVGRAGGNLAGNATTLFRLELPTGSTLQNLVPAIGGGFRGLVKSGETGKIAGQARLIPVAGAAGGATVALGPLIGLMALSVGTEMLARRQQDKKLEAIHRGVQMLKRDAEEKDAAKLKGAAQALETATAAILDKIEVPQSVGLGSACNDLRIIKNQALGWLERWEGRAAEDLKGGPVSFGKMRRVLAGADAEDSAYKNFPRQIETLYRALVLDSRALVLTSAEAALRSGDETLHHLQDRLRRSLQENAETQDRMRELLWQLAENPVTSSLPAAPKTGERVAELATALARLAAAAARMPDAPAILTPANRQVLELCREQDGTLRVLAPAA